MNLLIYEIFYKKFITNNKIIKGDITDSLLEFKYLIYVTF